MEKVTYSTVEKQHAQSRSHTLELSPPETPLL